MKMHLVRLAFAFIKAERLDFLLDDHRGDALGRTPRTIKVRDAPAVDPKTLLVSPELMCFMGGVHSAE